MAGVKGKDKIPKFKTPGETVILRNVYSEANISATRAYRADDLDGSFEFDKKNQTTRINFTKHPYIPLQVYKSLLKMGLSCINHSDVQAYRMAFDFIKNKTYDRKWKGFTMVYRYRMPYSHCHSQPYGMLFRKRDPTAKLYTHIFVLFAFNLIYEFILPMHINDLSFGRQKSGAHIPWIPPIFGHDYPHPDETIQPEILDFSSPETLKGENEAIFFPDKLESYETIKIINPDTGEITEEPFDSTKIAVIDIFRVPHKEAGPSGAIGLP
jgi:hypothetical protein